MADHSNDWVGQTLSGGRYRVDAKLGEGGMGYVYKVWDRNLDTDVVVKAPRKAMLDDPEFASRFALEIRSLVKLSHPHIVKVSDVGEHDAVPFAVMQYLDGGTLDERLDYGRDGRPLPAAPSSLAGWLPGMAAALDFIHGMGYIHRDVKPANILFDSHGHPYLSDFGVAKVLSDVEGTKKGPSGMTGVGIVLGTPEYMAPELIMGNQFDGKVDQYALAATAYEILCGRKPFTGETATAILVRQTTEAPPPMAELPASASQAIGRVIQRGLAKKPGDRYRTCAEFASDMMVALAMPGTPRRAVDRVICPNCGVSFAAPANLADMKGKKSKCQACGAPFRVANDGQSLVRLDPDAVPSPSGSIEIEQPPAMPSRANRTVKLDAMPSPATTPVRAERTMKLDALPNPPSAPARAERTMKLEAMPDPQAYGLAPEPRANRTTKLAALPVVDTVGSQELSDDDPGRPSPLPWIVGAVGVVAAAAIVAVVLTTRPTTVAVAPTPAGRMPASAKPKPTPIAPPSIARGIPPASTTPRQPSPPTPLGPPLATSPVAPPPATLPAPSSPAMTEQPPAEPPAKAEPPDAPPDAEKPDDPPGPAPKDLATKGTSTFKQIVSDPKKFLGQLVSPSDLLLVNSAIGPRRGVSARSDGGTVQALANPASPFRIFLNPELAAQLRDKINGNALVPGEYPAILQMKIEKDPENPAGFVGLVEWLELLYYIDPRPIVGKQRRYNLVYGVVHLGVGGASVGHSRSFKPWQDRIQTSTTNVRIAYENNNKPPVVAEMGQMALNPVGHALRFHRWIKQHFPIQ